MNHMESMEEAISFLLMVKGLSGKKAKRVLSEEIPNNTFLKTMIHSLKDEAVQLFIEELPKPVGRNDGRQRLANFFQFQKLTQAIKDHDQTMNEEVIQYFFTRLDQEEQVVYKMILMTGYPKSSFKPMDEEEMEKEEAEEDQAE